MAPVPYGGQHHQLGRRNVSNSHSHTSPLKKMDNSNHTHSISSNSTQHTTTHSLPVPAPAPNPQQAHALKLDEITRRVRDQSDRFQRAIMPVAEQLKEFADSNPVLFTFLATFTILSAFPTLIFVGFVLVLTFCIISTAVFLACASITGVVLFGSILLPILGATLALSGLLLVFLLGVFLAYRLLLHILEHTQDAAAVDGVLAGLRAWLDETRARVSFTPAPPSVKGSSEYKPYTWEPGSTPRGFVFRNAPGFPGQATDDEDDRVERDGDRLQVKTERAEESDWVSDADADNEGPLQSTPRQVSPARLSATPQVSSPLAPPLPSQPLQSPQQPPPQPQVQQQATQ